MENRRKPAPPAATLDINCDCKEYVVRQVGKTTIEHGFCGRDELDDNRIPIGKRTVDRW
jgi:hypothetical protein